MSTFSRSLMNTIKGSAKAFQTFPASIFCALAFAVVTIVRIQLDWPQQEPYNLLFNCLHWAFALGGFFSLAAIAWAQSRNGERKTFVWANVAGIVVAAVTFVLLYFFAATKPYFGTSRYLVVSEIATARMIVALIISFFAFVVVASYPRERSNFSQAFFMTLKAFFIATIYGGAMMAGTTGVARAVQALLYHDMSEKVYMYIATIVGFVAFTIFVGYFPSFLKGDVDEHREEAQQQPRFIEVLFDYILIPIMLALTVVLFLWAGKTILTSTWPSFVRLASIATTYTIGGILLTIMVADHNVVLVKFYKRAYPVAALIILAFEAWAFFVQLSKWGLKTEEYMFGLLWIFALVASVLLLIIKEKSHVPIVAALCALAVVAVLPVVNYKSMPVRAQSGRLEKVLASEGVLVGGALQPVTKAPSNAVRESVTVSVDFLANAHDVRLPAWFKRNLSDDDEFKKSFGFEKKWPVSEDGVGDGGGMGTYVSMPTNSYDISGYKWALNMSPEKETSTVSVKGAKGTYVFDWHISSDSKGIATLKVTLDGRTILDKDMNAVVDKIAKKYPPGKTDTQSATFDDLSLKVETPEIAALIVFREVSVEVDPQGDTINYNVGIDKIYFNEKP